MVRTSQPHAHQEQRRHLSYSAVPPALQPDLEWRVTYVGSAEDESFDQELDSVCVGPIHPGQYKFVFQVDPPDINLIPRMEAIGVTVILLTCSYNGKASDCFCHLRAKVHALLLSNMSPAHHATFTGIHSSRLLCEQRVLG